MNGTGVRVPGPIRIGGGRRVLKRLAGGACCWAAVLLPGVAAPLDPVVGEVAPFFSLRAGTSDRAGVEALLGAPLRQIKPDVYEYRAPPGAADIDVVSVEFFAESPRVARLDAWLKSPLPAAGLRARFGKTALQRTRKDGYPEELFFPYLYGLIIAGERPEQALAISYLAPRALADAFSDQAHQFIRDKRYAEAKEPADNAVQADPDYARGYLSQGIHYYHMKDYDEAMVRFVAAAGAKYTARKQAHARVWLALVLWKQKNQPDLAREEYRKALAIAPDFDTVHLEYGRFLKAQKQYDQAIEAFVQANRIGAEPVEPRMELAALHFERREWAKALPLLERLSEWADSGTATDFAALSRDAIYSRYAYALAAVRGKPNPLAGDDGSSARIIAAYEKAIRLNPRLAWVFDHLGREYAESGNLVKAEAAYRQALALDPKNLGVNRRLADLLLEARRWDEARRQAEFALTLKGDDTWQMMNVARAQAMLGRRDEALAWLRKAGAAGYKATEGLMLEDGYFDGLFSDDELRRLLPGRR